MILLKDWVIESIVSALDMHFIYFRVDYCWMRELWDILKVLALKICTTSKQSISWQLQQPFQWLMLWKRNLKASSNLHLKGIISEPLVQQMHNRLSCRSQFSIINHKLQFNSNLILHSNRNVHQVCNFFFSSKNSKVTSDFSTMIT